MIVSWIEFVGWHPPATGPLRSAYDLVTDVTEVALKPLRRIVPPAGMFDISVLVAFVIIFVASRRCAEAEGSAMSEERNGTTGDERRRDLAG